MMNYSGINKLSITDGIGCRVVLFVSGCTLRCPGCHNKDAQDFAFGKPYTQETEEFILSQLRLPYIDGLTLSGGEITDQDEEGKNALINLCEKAHSLGKNVWMYTGRVTTPEMLQDALLSQADTIVDGPYINAERDPSLPFRGSRNQRIIHP